MSQPSLPRTPSPDPTSQHPKCSPANRESESESELWTPREVAVVGRSNAGVFIFRQRQHWKLDAQRDVFIRKSWFWTISIWVLRSGILVRFSAAERKCASRKSLVRQSRPGESLSYCESRADRVAGSSDKAAKM